LLQGKSAVQAIETGARMKPGIPWSVKGIGEDAREAAKLAARRSGITLGEWLNSVILEQAEPEPSVATGAPLASHPTRENFNSKLGYIAAELQRLAVREQEGAHHHESIPEPRSECQNIAEIHMGEGQVEPLKAQLSTRGLPERRADEPAYQALESVLRNLLPILVEGEISKLSQRLDALQAANPAGEIQLLRGALESLDQRLGDLKADAASERDLRLLKAAMEQVSARMAQVSAQFEPQIAALEHRVHELDQRLAEAMHDRSAAPGLAALEARLATVQDTLDQIADKIAELGPRTAQPERAQPFSYVPSPIPELPAAVEEPPQTVARAGENCPPEDFIAAARRATQAAARQAPASAPSKSTPVGRANDGKRTRLIFAGLVLLAAVSAYVFGRTETIGRECLPIAAQNRE
jgi:hypothetical protein